MTYSTTRQLFSLVLMLVWGTSVAASVPIAVKDYLGRSVELDKPAQRIIALAPHIVENLFSAGVGDSVVGVVSYSDYPAAALAIPQVGGYSNFSLEAIVAFSPDLVIGWASGHGAFSPVIEQLTALGIPVYVDEPRKLGDVARSIRDFGQLGGNVAISEAAASAYLDRLRQLQTKYSQREQVTTFYQVWYEPLQTLNGEHIISDVIRLCGGTNIFADEPSLAPKVNIESILDRNPDAIVASGMGEARPDWLDNWKQWPSLTAVQHAQLYFVPPDLLQRHTERILTGAAMLCRQLDEVRVNAGK